jgi:hypothetical protein
MSVRSFDKYDDNDKVKEDEIGRALARVAERRIACRVLIVKS